MFPIHKFNNADMAFGASNYRQYMPAMSEIPAYENKKKYEDLASNIFFNGFDASSLVPKPNVNKSDALRHIRAILASFEPKHEHKIAAVAFFFYEWFEPINFNPQPVKEKKSKPPKAPPTRLEQDQKFFQRHQNVSVANEKMTNRPFEKLLKR